MSPPQQNLKRKILLQVTLGLLIALVSSQAGHSAEFNCDAPVTTNAMELCMKLRFKNAIESLAKIKKKIEPILSDDEREAFRAADHSWDQYRDTNCKSQSILYRGGSLEGLVEISCKARMTEERVTEISLIYNERLRGSGP